jgi:alpha-tubulin suppressor-like RCC1 family protein
LIGIKSLQDMAEIAAGGQTGCAISTAGALYCWGDNSFQKIGNGSTAATISSPVLIPGLQSVIRVAVGKEHICILDSACKVYCAGNNTHGQLGTGTTISSPKFIPVTGL